MFNLEIQLKRQLSSFRRIALGTWRTSRDPKALGTMDVRMDRALDYIRDFRVATGRRLTVTHLVARAVAAALRETPDANALLRLGRIYLRDKVSVCMQVVMTDEGENKVDLSAVTLHDAADKSLLEIADEVEARVHRVRKREDPALESMRRFTRLVPAPLMGLFVEAVAFFAYELNLDMSRLGLPRDAFGSIMVTNIGTLGLDVAYPPLVPYSRVPIVVAVGAATLRPVAEESEHGEVQIVARRVMRLSATFDHRFVDGYHCARLAQTVRRWLESPYEYFDAIERGASELAATGSNT
ncbi:MAG: 2-oxo acid dehydrogenase subunit E2 [Myxococcales bacterium]|nr:2-oxo acid dehydrogenase subunit E2 [Myxococcales bacterium]